MPIRRSKSRVILFTLLTAIAACMAEGPASAGWPEFTAGPIGGEVPIEEQLPGSPAPERKPQEAPLPETMPTPADGRCNKFGWDPAGTSMIPVAWPLVLDLTEFGTLQSEAVKLADSIAEYLAMTGTFTVNGRDMAPAGGAISWISPVAFDYLGWRSAGNWMVITATIDTDIDGNRDDRETGLRWVDGAGDGGSGGASTRAGRPSGPVEIVMSAFLTEEGDRLEIAHSSAMLPPEQLTTFAGRFVNAVSQCITGVSGTAETRIAYARKAARDGTKEIWVTRIGSGEQTQVSFDGQLAMLPAWAPGGSLAWTGYRNGNPDFYVDGVRFGDRSGMNTGIAWAPDGTVAAITWAPEAATDIYLVHPSTGAILSRLTSSPAIDTSPAWSPDSRQIAFVSDRNGTPNIFVMNADGSSARPLPLEGEYNTGPDWSPDGTTILYQSRGAGSRFSIWAYDVASRMSRRLSKDRNNNEEPSWSPDGRFIVYTSTRNGRKQLYIMNRDGSGARPVFTDGAEYYTPAWERIIPVRKVR